MKTIKKAFQLILVILTLGSCMQSPKDSEYDWPQFKYDNYRSAVTQVQLDLSTLNQSWHYSASHAPVPAWYGPAYEDAYANSGPLPSMRDYDLAYYPIIAGENMYYASTSDDAIHCIDNLTGKEKWRYTTNAPIHISPVYEKGKLYFGSDDGFVYCIKAQNGKLIWKYSPSPKNSDLVLNNGRLISYWPIRT
ncbi:MAG: PQQ-like beta-propeller repeat protein, partial [Bacteroidales bacterium]|nr:PQQ-like beta-propeller repeat protein [Bacteroidales bacterium]